MNTFDDFLSGRIGIRCDTKEQYDRLMQECEAKGLRWCGGEAPSQNEHVNDRASKPLQLATNRSGGESALYYRDLDEDLNDNIPCVPFSTIFPADPWAEFVAGRCCYHVLIKEWPEFRAQCKAAGISEDYGDSVEDDYYFFVVVVGGTPRLRHAHCRPPKDGHIHPFSAIARPEASKPSEAFAAACKAAAQGYAQGCNQPYDGTVRELRVRVDFDTSALKAAIQSVRAELKALPSHVRKELVK